MWRYFLSYYWWTESGTLYIIYRASFSRWGQAIHFRLVLPVAISIGLILLLATHSVLKVLVRVTVAMRATFLALVRFLLQNLKLLALYDLVVSISAHLLYIVASPMQFTCTRLVKAKNRETSIWSDNFVEFYRIFHHNSC